MERWMRGAVHKVPMGPRRASPTRQSPALSAIMSRRMANAQLRMLQSCGLPGLEGGAPSKRGKPGQTRKRQRGKRRARGGAVAAGLSWRRQETTNSGPGVEIAQPAIMSDVEKERRARGAARAARYGAKTRKSDKPRIRSQLSCQKC